jgi:biotin/methionine sulfoxide reductase
LVAFGVLPLKNTFVAPGGMAHHGIRQHLEAAQRRGMRIAHFSPLRDDVLPEAQARWYPVTPLGDVAVMLGLAHVLVSEGLHDAEFLERCCSGSKQFIAYVLGESDGVAKTPEWAEQRSGIAAHELRALAREMAAGARSSRSRTRCSAQHGECRSGRAHRRAAPADRPAGGDSATATARWRSPVPSQPRPADARGRAQPCAISFRSPDCGSSAEAGEFEHNGATLRYPDIRLVYWAGGNPFHHHQD